jgi:hypothetical protein
MNVAATRTAPMEAPVTAAARALVSVAAELVTGVQRAVVGPDNVRTARDNAWDAILADRARNQARADLTREVAEIVAAGRRREARAQSSHAQSRGAARTLSNAR